MIAKDADAFALVVKPTPDFDFKGSPVVEIRGSTSDDISFEGSLY